MNPARCLGCLCLCCDIITRLSNDVQGLLQEMEYLLKLQSSYYSLQEQFNNLLDELETKLDTLTYFKGTNNRNNCLTLERIEDFRHFVRLVWHNIQNRMENKWSAASFLSILEGSPLVPTLVEIVNFVTEISSRFGAYFVHTECSALFNELSHQVNYVIYPELALADDFDKSLSCISDTIPCLINLITIIDLFAHTSKYDSIGALCHEIIDEVPLESWKSVRIKEPKLSPTKYLVSLLTGELLRENDAARIKDERSLLPVVKHSTVKMDEYVHRMSEYLLELSVTAYNDRRKAGLQKPWKAQTFQYRCTNHPYGNLQLFNPTSGLNQSATNMSAGSLSSVFSEMGLSPAQVQYMLQHQHQHQQHARRNKKRSYEDDGLESGKNPKRGSSGGTEVNDLQPIRVPRLSDALIKPFFY